MSCEPFTAEALTPGRAAWSSCPLAWEPPSHTSQVSPAALQGLSYCCPWGRSSRAPVRGSALVPGQNQAQNYSWTEVLGARGLPEASVALESWAQHPPHSRNTADHPVAQHLSGPGLPTTGPRESRRADCLASTAHRHAQHSAPGPRW